MAQKGWGSGGWGGSTWGVGLEAPIVPIPPQIIPIDPRPAQTGIAQTKPLSIKLIDDTGVMISTLRVTVGGVIWVIGGVAANGATLVSNANQQKGFDIEVSPPSAYPLGSRQEVTVYVEDFHLEPTELVYSFSVGVGARLLAVRNPTPNLLLAHFNRPMQLDASFFFVPNWVVAPVTEGAAPLVITEVAGTTTQPDVAHIRYTGGGSEYSLTVLNSILSQAGDPLERGFNSVVFEILFGEEEPGEVHLFDSIFGPLGISQRLATRRSIDDHTADRSLALALDEQFRLRFQQVDGTSDRDGKSGKLRTS